MDEKIYQAELKGMEKGMEKENVSEAQKYYQLAAAQGHKGAQELLQNRIN